MTDADRPFLNAIIAAPNDDAPRLVYADWLDEHGRPERAALIRSFIADPTAQVRYRTGLNDGWVISGVARRGVSGWSEAAASELYRWRRLAADWTFHRGLWAGVTLSTAAYRQRVRTIFSELPIVEVRLRDREPALSRGSWVWAEGRPDDGQHYLPPDLYWAHGKVVGRFFRSIEAAYESLSRACVALGRRKAGLRQARAPMRPAP